MIVVRNTFRLKFGKAKEAKALLKEVIELNKKQGIDKERVLADFTGESYRLVFESEHSSLAEFENSIQKVFESQEWQNLYKKIVPLVDSGSREILSVVM